MTFREFLTNELTSRGMWPDEAETVVNLFLASLEGKPIRDRVEDQIEGYPPQLMMLLQISIMDFVRIWIRANRPNAVYRSAFADS